MKKLTLKDIRDIWVSFFKSKDHLFIKSYPLVPIDDDSILWINAGVTPLKGFFDGSKKPISNRLCNIQKCIRTNDIENVGITKRHHTFFEMLGNFSIGSYFKKEAISYAYEILFSDKYFSFDKDRIYITYYYKDYECYNMWQELGIEKDHLISMESNFWEIGEGPCGPNTEIFFDRGSRFGDFTKDCIKDDIENDRFVEIWNIVFSEFNSEINLSRDKYKELPQKNIDTGSGLERMLCIFEDKDSNFETSLFMPIIKKLEDLSNIKYIGQKEFKIISDHIKAVCMALSDGAFFSNEKRGYVLRRLLRRALKYGFDLGLNDCFLYKLVDSVCDIYSCFYEDLILNKDNIKSLILQEEKKFILTLLDGKKRLDKAILNNTIDEKMVFILFDTYGYPIELTIEYLEDKNIKIDKKRVYEYLDSQKEKSRLSNNSSSNMNLQDKRFLDFTEKSNFLYDLYELDCKIIKIFDNGIVLDNTIFYTESGGQESDVGYFIKGDKKIDIIGSKKLPNNQIIHFVSNEYISFFNEQDNIKIIIDKKRRDEISKNHSAAHLLHFALSKILGPNVSQKGQNVSDMLFRFDFNYNNKLTEKEILAIEDSVNNIINDNITTNIYYKNINEVDSSCKMLFSDVYKDIVRVVDMKYTKELCCGTHVNKLKSLDKFFILSCYSIQSGIYRIEAGCNKDIFIKYNEVIINNILKYRSYLGKNLENNDYLFSYKTIIDLKEEEKILEKEYILKQKQLEEKEYINIYNNIISNLDNNKNIILEISLNKAHLKKLCFDILDKNNKDLVCLINKSDSISLYIASNKYNLLNVKEDIFKLINCNGGGKQNFIQLGTKDSNIELVINYLRGLK